MARVNYAIGLARTHRINEAWPHVPKPGCRIRPVVRQAKLQHDRDLYRAGKPAVSPWAEQDPLLAPASLPEQLARR